MQKMLVFAALAMRFFGATAVFAEVPQVEVQQFDATDEAVCKLATSLSPDELSKYTVENLVTPVGLKIGPGEFGELIEPSKGESKYIAISDYGLPDDYTGPDEDGFLLSTRILPYAGRVYFLAYSGTHPLYLRTITRYLHDGQVMAVCDLKPKEDIDLRAESAWRVTRESKQQEAADKDICDHVRKKKVTYLAEHKYARIRSIGLNGGNIDAEAKIAVDFRNSGKPETLERYRMMAGSYRGCMSGIEYVARGKKWDHNDPVLKRLQDRTSSDWTIDFQSDGRCRDGPVRWFTYKGKTYLETQSYHSQEPQNEFQEYWFVSTAEAGRVRRICSAAYIHGAPELVAVHKDGHVIEQ